MRPPRNFYVKTFKREAGMLSRVAENLYWMSRYLERAEHTAQRVVPGQGIVAVGHQQHSRQALHPGTEVAQHVEGRAVGPVDVLDHEHGR